MMNKRRAKLKNGDARKMKMGGDYMEPSKEVKFGGPSKPMKYSPGGEKKEGDKTYTKAVGLPEGATSNYKGEVFDKDGNKIGKRVSGSTPKYVPNERNAGSRSKASADYINRSRGRTKAQIAKDESNAEMAKEADKRMAALKEQRDKEATAKAAEKRGPSREEKQNTPQGTSQNNKAKGQSPASKPKTPTPPKAAPAAVEKRKATSVPMRTSAQIEAAKPKPASATKVMLSGMSQKGTTAGKAQAEARFAGATRATKSATGAASTQKSTTKNTTADSPKSKRTARIDRRTERVTNRKEKAASRPTRIDRKADRMNKRADRVEARKEKKADVNAAKARLKAARRLQSGGMKTPTEDQKGLKKLPTSVRNKMGYKKYGGKK